jgi:hypothetical protein
MLDDNVYIDVCANSIVMLDYFICNFIKDPMQNIRRFLKDRKEQ